MRKGTEPDLLLLLEAGNPLDHMPAWPAHVRAEYESALRAAGFAFHPHAALAEPHPPWPARDFHPHDPGAPDRIDASVLALWPRATGDQRLRTSMAIALRESAEMRRLLGESLPGE